MAASKFAEKLIILCDQATGIQCRLYQLLEPTFKRPVLFVRDGEIDKFASLFLKKFPDFPETLNKEKGADVFKKRAPEITTALNDFYCTFLELLNFTEESWKLLVEIAGSIQEFKMELNVDLLSYYFNLFTRYVQIHMLVGLIDTPQLFLASFARAFYITSGNTEPNFLRIAKYLSTFRPNAKTSPLKKIQEDAQAISLCVGNTLMTFMPTLMKYANVAGYSNGKLFNVLQEDARNLTVPVNEKAQLEVLHLANLRQWTLFGFLCCPAELARNGALDMLNLCLRETFQLTLFRDKSLSIHKEFEELMDYKSANGAFKLSKHKKMFKDAMADDDGTRKFHLDLRTYLCTELEVFAAFFAECPSTIPAKLSMITALLALTRNEVVWFFRHQHVTPHGRSSSKVKGLPYDPQVSQMIDLTLQITRMLEASKKEIQAYYVEFLTKHDAPKAKLVCEPFLASLHNPQLAALVHGIIDHLAERTAGDNLEALRLNWYRVSAAVNHQQSGIPIHTTQAFSAIMNQIVHHSRNIDLLDTQLKTHCSFQLLFFYKADVFTSLTAALQSPDGEAAHCIAYVQLLQSAMHNIHRLCPDEQPALGKEVVHTGDQFIHHIVRALEKSVNGIIHDTTLLKLGSSTKAVLSRMNHVNQMALNPQLAPMPVPGAESHYDNRRMGPVQNLAAYQRTVSDICASISANESVVLYNIEFVPREYVNEAISNNIRGAIVGLAVQGQNISKPTMILSRLRDIIHGFSAVERALNLNVHDLVREVLISEFAPTAEEVAALQGGIEGGADPNRPVPVIMHIAAWYANFFNQDLASLNIVYSSIKKAFVSRRSAGASAAPGGLEFERFTDVSELRALALLLGPAGINVIDRALLKIVTRQSKVLKEVLQANQQVLQTMNGRFTEQSVWLENIPHLLDLDKLCSATTIVGCILHFRQLLRDALAAVTQEKSPFLFEAVALAHRAIHDSGVVVDARLSGIDQAAADVGLEVGEADHPLRLALATFKTTVADMNLFQLLPELYGLMYLSNRWRGASFSIEFEGHTNNAHCQALAVRQYLVQFNRLTVKENSPLEVEKRIALDLERFIRCSAFTMLHMKALNAKEKEAINHYPLQPIMIFLEQCILAFAGRVEMNLLESCFPFTILRSTYIQLYEQQTNNYAQSPVAGDPSAD